jgi:hypothetical protein
MAATDSESVPQPRISLLIIGVLLVVGLGLFFWLAPRTPVVATPIETEATS